LLSNSDQNFVDPSSHWFELGSEWSFHHFLESETSWSFFLDLHYQAFTQESIQKSQATLIGAPGYTIGGYSAGILGGLSFKL
jgi:hypothetical protein